jgi:hypothetical protein
LHFEKRQTLFIFIIVYLKQLKIIIHYIIVSPYS